MTDVAPPPPPVDPTPATPGVPAGWYNDPASGRQRWWDGTKWTENFNTGPAAPVVTNSAATAALILGIIGFVVTPIPLFIGFFLGGTPALLAVIFGIIGLVKGNARQGVGVSRAVVGLILGALAIVAIFFGAGTIW